MQPIISIKMYFVNNNKHPQTIKNVFVPILVLLDRLKIMAGHNYFKSMAEKCWLDNNIHLLVLKANMFSSDQWDTQLISGCISS